MNAKNILPQSNLLKLAVVLFAANLVVLAWACKVRVSVGEVKAIASENPTAGTLKLHCAPHVASGLELSKMAREVYPLGSGVARDGYLQTCIAWKEY